MTDRGGTGEPCLTLPSAEVLSGLSVCWWHVSPDLCPSCFPIRAKLVFGEARTGSFPLVGYRKCVLGLGLLEKSKKEMLHWIFSQIIAGVERESLTHLKQTKGWKCRWLWQPAASPPGRSGGGLPRQVSCVTLSGDCQGRCPVWLLGRASVTPFAGEAWLGCNAPPCVSGIWFEVESPLCCADKQALGEDAAVYCTVGMATVSLVRGPLFFKDLGSKPLVTAPEWGLAVLLHSHFSPNCSSYSAVLQTKDSSNRGTTQLQRKPPGHAGNGYSSPR